MCVYAPASLSLSLFLSASLYPLSLSCSMSLSLSLSLPHFPKHWARPMPQQPCWAPTPMKTIHEEHVTILANRSLVTCGICHCDLEEAGLLGSFTRHTTTMASPNVPRCVSTCRFPITDLADWMLSPPCRMSLFTRSTLKTSASKLTLYINGQECHWYLNKSLQNVSKLIYKWQQRWRR